MKFRKTPPIEQIEHERISSVLRTASAAIDRGHYEEALGSLNALPPSEYESSDRRCQVSCLAAQALFAQGRLAEASSAYSAAWVIGGGTPVKWFSAAIGQVRCQLKNVEVSAATATGRQALEQAERLAAGFTSQAVTAGASLGQTGSVVVERKPIRPSVAAFRLGQQFFDEGEPQLALWFFTRAAEYSPRGACRARIAIAAIDLQNESFQKAYDGARAVLLSGRFQARTLCAWSVLIAASQRLGISGVNPRMLRGLAQAPPSVRGRARLIIARTLRSFGDPGWAEVAAAREDEDPNAVLRAEFLKMKVASASRRPGGETNLSGEAAEFLATPNLGPKEWLGAAKAQLRGRLARGEAPRIAELINEGIARYGAPARGPISHGLALACRAVNRNELALEILRPLTADVDKGRASSLWLRAQLEAEGGNPEFASSLFLSLSNRTDISPRFRMLATLEWTRLVVQTGDTAALATAAPRLVAATQSITDYELVLDLARQMTMAPPEVAALAPGVFARGEQLAWAAFRRQSEPPGAVEILFKVARRQSDFGAYAEITHAWAQLSETKRDWLWCPTGQFWQYLGLVAAAYRQEGRRNFANQLVQKYLNDPATPPNGLAELGIPHALDELSSGGRREAFEWFEWLTAQAPTHELCAYAYYWLALRAQRSGDTIQVTSHLRALRLSLGSSAGLQWMKDLDVRGRLLEGESVEALAARSEYSQDYLQIQNEEIRRDLARL